MALNLALCSVAALAVFLNRPGEYIPDFRFEVTWAPGQTAGRIMSLWQTAGGLGGVAGTDRNPLTTFVFGIGRALGAEPWLAQRLWHLLLLCIAGTGVVRLLRFYRPRVGALHAVAGFAYMFSPTGLGLLLPSSIFGVYCIAPWMLSALVGGTTGRTPWRWAAVFGLGIVLVAPVEMPATIYLVGFLGMFSTVLVHVSRITTWRAVIGWTLKAGVLTTLCMSFALARTLSGGGSLERRLFITELPEDIAGTTSWSEVFRGKGHWLSYFRAGLTYPRPNFVDWFENPVVVAATMLVPLVALGTLLIKRSRPLRPFLLVGFASLVLATGLHPVDDPGPWGRLVGWLYDAVPSATLLRSTMKSAWPWALTVAVLFGLAVDTWYRRQGNRLRRGAVLSVGVGLLVASTFPVWSGNLYAYPAVDKVPGYWQEATDWLDEQPTDGSTIILPGTPFARYRWGDPGDDIFQARLHREFLMPTVFTTSAPSATDAVYEIEARIESGFLNEASIVPALRRLGVRYVLIRNDLLWEEVGLPRPFALAPLRSDPDLTLVATFGERGENTRAVSQSPPGELGRTLLTYEKQLHPVEIYEVDAPESTRATDQTPSIILAGDGEGWQRVDALSPLATHWPIRYAARLDAEELRDELATGSVIVVSDTNVRRAVASNGGSVDRSGPLYEVQTTNRADAIFEGSAAQTVEWMADAKAVDSSVDSLKQPWARASQAFDDDLSTAWTTRPFEDPEGQWLRVTMREPTEIGRVTLISAAGQRKVSSGSVRLDDGAPWTFDFDDGVASIDLGGEVGSEVTFAIEEVTGVGAAQPGFSEIAIAGLDLRPHRRVPHQLFELAENDAPLARAIGAAPLAFSFEREDGVGPVPAETTLRRRFFADSGREFTATGRLQAPNPENVPEGCVPWLDLDGQTVTVRVEPRQSPGQSATYTSCQPMILSRGWHEIEGADEVVVDSLVLAPVDLSAPSPDSGAVVVDVIGRSAGEATMRVATPESGGQIITNIAYDAAWSAELDGTAIDVLEMDSQLGVRVDGAGDRELVLTYRPQRTYAIALVLSLTGIFTCVGILAWPRRTIGATMVLGRRPTAASSEPSTTSPVQHILIAVVLVLVYLGAGLSGLFAGLAALALTYAIGPTIPIVVGLGLLGGAAGAVLLEGDLSANFSFALNRPTAALLVRLAMAVLVTTMTGSGVIAARDPVTASTTSRGPGWRSLWRPLAGLAAIFVVAFVVATALLNNHSVPSQAIAALENGAGLERALEGLDGRQTVQFLWLWLEAIAPISFAQLSGGLFAIGLVSLAVTPRATHDETSLPLVSALGALLLLVVAIPTIDPPSVAAMGLLMAATAWFRVPTLRAAALAGLAGGLAALLVPEAGFVFVLLAILWTSAERRLVTRQCLAISLGGLMAIAGWLWVAGVFGSDTLGELVAWQSAVRFLIAGAALYYFIDRSRTGGERSSRP